MTTTIDLRWQTSTSLSCFHAAEAVLHQRSFVWPALAEALAEPVARLQEALVEERVPPAAFWAHLLPLSASNAGAQELAQVALTKSVGQAEASTRVRRIQGLLHDIRRLFPLALPEVNNAAAWTIKPLQQRWNERGSGLLGRMALWTEPEILVEDATVVGVFPVLDGGGGAYPYYNLVHIEALADDPTPELPETMRLAWLLSTLNLNLPRYSDHIRGTRFLTVACLAMLPVALAAATDVRMVDGVEPLLELAVRTWMPPSPHRETWNARLGEWWEKYRAMRPPWSTALKGLDRLLE
ncbi:MAG: hypothetical protein K2R98_19200 [Gemmataceae bacterium]|nr:hypothetical protein [Gemmataceae bacterium]